MPDAAPPPAPKINVEAAQDTRLLTSIEDAYALLDLAARRAMRPGDAITGPIIDCHDKAAQRVALNAQEEAAFWQAFSDIIEMVKPVTVESILFTTERNERASARTWIGKVLSKRSPADKVLRRYLAGSLLSLLVLLALQVEWAIGMSIYNDAYEIHGSLQQTTDEVAKAEEIRDSLNDNASDLRIDAQVILDKLLRRQAQEKSWNDVSYVHLWWWNRGMAALIPPYDLQLSNGQPGGTQAGTFMLDKAGERRIEFTRAQLTLEIISDYVLVTLFALLGSMTQALRKLSAKISSVSLTTNSLYRIRTRIILGVISGVCMAWLLIISSSNGNGQAMISQSTPLSAISFLGAFAPWAMAFISGYSVEIFFAALERGITFLIQHIKGKETVPPPARPVQAEAHKPSPSEKA
ncbi:MAG: hypothetical protein JKY27_04995 [Magnetovibrio sp.]|nr:hypothetical protein [Magnetovibrio sp.]